MKKTPEDINMTDYDDLSVHELVKKAYQVGHDDWPALALEFKELPLIESALRKAVICEERRADDDRMGYNGH